MMDISTGDRPVPQNVRIKWYRILYVQVIIAITIGILLGHFYPSLGESMKPLGDAFIKLVKMIIAPVIFLTVATGIAAMTDLQKVGRVVGKAMIYFLTFSTLALIVGLVVSNIVQPGHGMNIDPSTLDPSSIQGYVQQAHDSTLTGFLMNIIPATLISPFTGGDILQVLFVAVLFGIALAAVGDHGKPVLKLLQALMTPVFKLVAILMKAAPIGAFGAISFTIGKYGISTLTSLGRLIGLFYGTSLFFVVVVLGGALALLRISIFRLLRHLREEFLIVLGTSSSESVLPRLTTKLTGLGVRRDIVGLTVPTGYSFNLDGSSIYLSLAAVYIAQATDTPLSLGQQLGLLAVMILTSKGSGGVTGAGFIALAATLSSVGTVPAAGIMLILGIDKFMSECRALTNLAGNSVATLLVARWEGALDTARVNRVLRTGIPEPPAEPEPAATPPPEHDAGPTPALAKT